MDEPFGGQIGRSNPIDSYVEQCTGRWEPYMTVEVMRYCQRRNALAGRTDGLRETADTTAVGAIDQALGDGQIGRSNPLMPYTDLCNSPWLQELSPDLLRYCQRRR